MSNDSSLLWRKDEEGDDFGNATTQRGTKMPGKLLAELSTQLLYHLILSILVFGVENSLFIGVAEPMNAIIQFIGGENPNCLGAVNTFPISTILILAFSYLLVYEGKQYRYLGLLTVLER